ncbi:amino acid aminotransferase (plasmid) [Cupriavidus basilensis]
MFDHVEAFPGDPILSLNETFQQDPRDEKVNLTIGIYFDDSGKLPIMAAVKVAEGELIQNAGPRPYLPMSGIPDYRSAVQALVFGEECVARQDARVATVQTLGGSGALRVGADFLKRYMQMSKVWISDPSWENHRVIFERAGFQVESYPYYDPQTGGLQFEAMLEAIRRIPRGDIVLLHACCHNPTGVDLDQVQWQQVIESIKEGGLLPFVDMAYQGLGGGLEEDAHAIREFVRQGVSILVANSFSKNFSLYGERCGALSVVCRSNDEADRVLGQLSGTVRANYSNPPTHGASIVAKVLNDTRLRTAWEAELAAMKQRMTTMRGRMYEALEGRVPLAMRERYSVQRGMFTYTGLSTDQVDRLRDESGVYLLRSGRLCVAGLNAGNVDTVAAAIARVV